MPMFTPKNPFSLVEKGAHYGKPGKYSSFIREVTKVPFQISGVYCNIYRLLGTYQQDRDEVGHLNDELSTNETETASIVSLLGVEDAVLGENRDRAYDLDTVPVLQGVYTISASEMELLRFGYKSNETISMEFHQEMVEETLGRRFVEGDVVELPHLREVGFDGRVANKWYEVKHITWSPSGYDATYQRHIVGVILSPLRDQQEFFDIFYNHRDEYGKTLGEQMSNEETAMELTDRVTDLAKKQVSQTMFNNSIMWYDPNDTTKSPTKFVDDAMPPNGAEVEQGTGFPGGPVEGQWFLRTDLNPNRLYQYSDSVWSLREVDDKREWQPYNWTKYLRGFMSDHSDTDAARGYELRSIHDVVTDLERKSDPSRIKGSKDET